jgi:rhomboid protease GluP
MTEQGTAPPPPSLLERVKGSPLTFAIAAINVAVFLWAESHGDTTRVPTLLRFGADEQLHVASGEYWRLVTSMFLHIGWVHLAWNTYASVGWCTAVERVLGKGRFLVIYLASGIGGACVSALAHRVTSAGASGAMFGIVGATLAIRYRQLGSFHAFTRDRFVRANLVNMAIWTVIGLTAVSMDNFAHGGGLVVGTAAALAATSRRRRAAAWASVGAATLALVVLAARPGWTPRDDAAGAGAAYATGYALGLEGFPRNPARAQRLAELVCRAPATPSCAQAAWALRDSDDAAAKRRGAELLQRACSSGYALACPGHDSANAP